MTRKKKKKKKMKKQTKTVTLSTKSSTCESLFLKDHNVIFNQSRPPMGVPIQNLMLVNVLHSGETSRANARECFPECGDPVLASFHNDIFTRDSLPRSTVSMDVSIQKSMPAKVLQSEYKSLRATRRRIPDTRSGLTINFYRNDTNNITRDTLQRGMFTCWKQMEYLSWALWYLHWIMICDFMSIGSFKERKYTSHSFTKMSSEEIINARKVDITSWIDLNRVVLGASNRYLRRKGIYLLKKNKSTPTQPTKRNRESLEYFFLPH